MVEYIKLLYEIVDRAVKNGTEKEVIKNIIILESKQNLDLIDVSRRIKEIDLKIKAIDKLETTSIELFKLGNIPYAKVFRDGDSVIVQSPNESENRTKSYYENKSETYLYEFCVRKSITLKKLVACESPIDKYIKIDTRLKNLSFAYIAFIKKLLNG